MKKVYWFILILLTACTGNKSKPLPEQIDELFSAELKNDEPGGAVLVILNGDTILKKGYGISDINTKEKITSNTLFNVGSISKTFVTNTILSLAAEGKLNVNDSLYKYFPGFKNPAIAKKVKLHHMLTHTSGLPDNRWALHDSVYLLTAKDQENWNPILQNDSLLFEPGTKFEYSNPAFNGLALIIEKITGKKWQDVVKERIFVPANMPSSKITDGPYPQSGVAHGYIKFGNTFIEKDYGEEPTFAAAGNGGVWSSVNELANYETALRSDKILKKDLLEHSRSIMRYSRWKGEVPPFIGYSWFISQTTDSVKIVSHTGTQGGFYADFVSIPEKGFLYVVLCNRRFPREEFRKKILEMINLKPQELY
ncbi:MAG TPA: serine hydrolase domain-containing protein, partial [Chitinophagaceae bacterium]|nr:serine hydrolase domain-containing protein [Chitinophagaceae bacterium]